MNLLLDCGADLSLPSYADYDFGSLIEQGIADGFTVGVMCLQYASSSLIIAGPREVDV